MQITNRSRILFILFVILGIYYPTIFAGVNSVDDFRMISTLEDIQQVNWQGLFIPGGGFYYRPLLMLTFFADKYFWGFDESFMHLENILIHAGNAVLLFLIGLKVFRRPEMQRLELPLLSALLFALHPINTEAVAWISGRTDPLASLFVLLSLLTLIKGLESDRIWLLFCSTLLLIVGGMCKEVAVFFFPVSCIIAYYWQNDAAQIDGVVLSKGKVVRVLTVAAPFILGGVGYLGVRLIAFDTFSRGFNQIFSGYRYDSFNTLRVIFKVFGFYVKKLFIPLPLNFAILKLDNNYVWLGIAVAILMLLLFIKFRRCLPVIFFISAFYLIAPAILVALSGVAWTPVAERYLYLPSAMFTIGLVGVAYLILESKGTARLLAPGFALLLFPAAYATMQRSITWQDNLTLYQDTLAKSPGTAFLNNELAIALIAKGKESDADLQIEQGRTLDSGNMKVLLSLNQSKLRLKQDKVGEAREILLKTFSKKSDADEQVLKMLAVVDEKRLFSAKKSERISIQREIMDTHEHLYPKTGDPISLYRGGQMALFLGEKQKASELFRKAYQVAPDDAYYKQAALKLAEKLSQ